jgi:CubicO group peptidase (beta-lactamase class C family)
VQRAGPDWVAVHGISSDDYQIYFNTQSAAGYAPVLVTATGPADSAIFAAVFEKDVPGGWIARHGLTFSAYNNENAAAGKGGRFLRSMSIYGTSSDHRYAGVWFANSDGYVRWYYHDADPASSYQQTFDTETKARQYRPAFVTLASDETYASVFTDQWVGPWIARHGMSAADYQAEFDRQNAAGLRPIVLQGGGSAADSRYAAIFAQRDWPGQYEVHYDGVEGRPSSLSGFDDLMNAIMRTNGIHAAQLTLLKDGNIKYAVAFTRREVGSDYQLMKTTDCFRLASCTKIFLEAAVQSLYDANKLKTDTKVYPLLGFSSPKDARSDDITIQQLLDHVGGYDDSSTGSSFDPTFQMVKIAKDLGLNRAVTKQDVMQYMYNRMLDYKPGSPPAGKSYIYSNYGYLLAGAVVEKVSGQKFFDYVRDTLLKPLSLTDVQPSPTAQSLKPMNEPPYESTDYGQNALDPTSTTQVPAPYGGAGHILEVDDSAAGFAASATALAKFIHVHKVWGNGSRSDYKSSEFPVARKGSDPGALSFAWSRADGVDWAVIFNCRDWPTDWDKTSDNFAASVNDLLDRTAF